MQAFAGLGDVDLGRYWQPTGALGRTTEPQGLSRNRQNRCQYANDLKWPVRPLQASPHNTPRAADPTPYATHTQWRGGAATSHTTIAALANRTRYYCHTCPACPARTFGKDRQALGQLYVIGTIIPWRTSPFRAFVHWRAFIAARNRDEIAGAAASEGKWPEFRSSRSGGAFTTLFAGSRRPRSAGRARSVWQSFHAFGNVLAKLHHLLA